MAKRRGPAPKPTALRIAEGNPGGRKLNTGEPKPGKELPCHPDWLKPAAKAAWRRLVPQLAEMGVLGTVDRDALAAYCQTWAHWVQTEKFLATHGDVYPLRWPDVVKPDGTVVPGAIRYMQQFPQVAIARQLLQTLHGYQQEFGMTPAARSRVTTGGGGGDGSEEEDLTARLLGV